jgi:hypothetical protein
MYTKGQLDFAYKYPFSDEGKVIIKEIDPKNIDQKHLIIGKARVEEALERGRIDYVAMDYGRVDFVIGYVYARMLVSALKSAGSIARYAGAEAARATDALLKDSDDNLIRLAGELGLGVKRNAADSFSLGFAQFLANMPSEQDYTLANHRLDRGVVTLDRYQTIKTMGVAITKSVIKGLPIKTMEMPRAVLEYAKEVKIPIPKVEVRRGPGNIYWIDKLLATPIFDARHRTVNLILAPYLVNIKGMPVDKAAGIISNYIALCKVVNPDTRITDRYIRYQCEYAKAHGMRPLSLARARNELGGSIDFDVVFGEEARQGGAKQ